MGVCVLVSGGPDSVALLGRALRLGRATFPLYVRCGLSWEKAELFWLRRFLKAVHSPHLRPLTVLDMPMRNLYGGHWSLTGRGVPGVRSFGEAVYLPGRNLLLLTHAAVFCSKQNLKEVWMATLKGNPFGDATGRFLKAAETASRLALGRKIKFLTPFRTLSKRQVLAGARGLPLHLSFSCLSPRGLRPCGRCNKCAEMKKASSRRGEGSFR
jgi:7-cyano-7-deazaguanine synthase